MKIRSNYVSNSSSSSFLILYHSKKDFGKFCQFKGYDILMNNIKDIPESNDFEFALDHIRGIVERSVSDIKHYIIWDEEKWRNYDWNYSSLERLSFEDKLFNSFDQFTEPIYEFRNKAVEIYEKMQSDNKGKDTSKILEEFAKIEPDCEKIANDIFNWLKLKGWNMTAVEYCDECGDPGSYMEHEFMPFVAVNPEREYCINQLSKH